MANGEVDQTKIDAKDQNAALAGSSKDFKAQMKTAAQLEEALAVIRSVARTNDYFVGYSLAEVVKERIDTIGEKDSDDDKEYSEMEIKFVPGSATAPKERTRMARLNWLWATLLGTDEGGSLENGGAIGRALNFKTIKDLAWPEDDADESTGL
jgi:hypothetical protein